MKPVKIQIAKVVKWNQPFKMLDWDGYPTIIPGLYLTRPLGRDELPEGKGWNVTHQKSGHNINFTPIKSRKKARKFIKILESKKLNWEVTYEELEENFQFYLGKVKEAMNDNT